MSGILNSAAQRINADTAGQTKTGTEANAIDAGPTPGESFHSVLHTASGAFDSWFRQEPAPPEQVVSNPGLAAASTASRGPNGGWVPAALSRLRTGMQAPSPGPGPGLNRINLPMQPAEVVQSVKSDTVQAAQSAKVTLQSLTTQLRKLLGV